MQPNVQVQDIFNELREQIASLAVDLAVERAHRKRLEAALAQQEQPKPEAQAAPAGESN